MPVAGYQPRQRRYDNVVRLRSTKKPTRVSEPGKPSIELMNVNPTNVVAHSHNCCGQKWNFSCLRTFSGIDYIERLAPGFRKRSVWLTDPPRGVPVSHAARLGTT